MKQSVIIITLILGMAFMNLGSAMAADDVIKWKMQSFMPASSNLHQYLQEFCDKVKLETNGRLQITLFPGNSLFPNLKVFQNVKAGVVDLAHTAAIYYQGEFPESVSLTPPFGFMHSDDYYALWHYRGGRELFAEFYKKHGLITKVGISVGEEPIWSREPIRTIDDFKGKKIRMTGAAAKFFSTKLGASVTMLGPAELYTALSNGTIDACEFTGGSMDYALGLHKVTKYMILPHYLGSMGTELLINQKSYDKLPEDVRRIFNLCCTWANLEITHKMHRDNQIAIKKMMKEDNMQVIWLPDEDMKKIRALAVEYWEQELAAISPNTKRYIEIYKEIARERGLID